MPTCVIKTWYKSIRKKKNNWTLFPGPFLRRTVFTGPFLPGLFLPTPGYCEESFPKKTGFTSEDDQKGKKQNIISTNSITVLTGC